MESLRVYEKYKQRKEKEIGRGGGEKEKSRNS